MADNIRDAYSVNLADDLVPNAAKRNRMYQGMLLYFIVCGALMIEGGWRIAHGYINVKDAKRQKIRIIEDFKASHSGMTDMKSYAATLKTRLDRQKKTFSDLDKKLPVAAPGMELMYELMQVVPTNSTLMSYQISSAEEGVTWQCRVIHSGEERIDSNELVTQWRQDESLQKYVSNIMMMNLKDNLFVNGVPAEIITCRAKLNTEVK